MLFGKTSWMNITGSEKVALAMTVQIISWLLGLLHGDAFFSVGIQCLLENGLYAMTH